MTQNSMPVFQKVSFVQQSVQAFFSLHSFSLFPGICPSVCKVFQAYSCKAYQELYKGGGKNKISPLQFLILASIIYYFQDQKTELVI